MRSVATGPLPAGSIPAAAARLCKKIVEIKIPLVSFRRLCTHGLVVTFDEDDIYVFTKAG